MALQIASNVTQRVPDILNGSNYDHHLEKRQAGGAAVATGVLALATIAMITEFIVYSGFTPKVRSNFPWLVLVITLILTFLYNYSTIKIYGYHIPNAEYFLYHTSNLFIAVHYAMVFT